MNSWVSAFRQREWILDKLWHDELWTPQVSIKIKKSSKCKLLVKMYLLIIIVVLAESTVLIENTCWRNSVRSSPPAVFLRKGALKICSKFTGEHPCWSVISIKLLWNFIEITFWHGCSPGNLLHIFRIPFPRIAYRGLLLLSQN